MAEPEGFSDEAKTAGLVPDGGPLILLLSVITHDFAYLHIPAEESRWRWSRWKEISLHCLGGPCL